MIYVYSILNVLIFIHCFSLASFIYANEKFSNYRNYPKTKESFQLIKIADNFEHPWGMTFLDKENLLITEKRGKLFRVNVKDGVKTEIKHNINVFSSNQGGLLDVLSGNDNFIYFTYSHLHKKTKGFDNFKKSSSTAIARGRLIKNEIKDLEILLIGEPKLRTQKHYGSRIMIKDNHIFASFGERDMGMIAQDPGKHPGSIIRINKDGSIPKDNPKYKGKLLWLPEIFQIGLRNPQGLGISPHDNKIYFTNHGPRGGDSIGIVKFGGNYGWKNIAWGGTEYSGRKIGNLALSNIYDEPLKVWVPSIGIGNFQFYNGSAFKSWNGDILVTATKTKMLIRLAIKENQIISEEIILKDKIGRIRDLEVDSQGNIYLISDESRSGLWKMTK